MSTISFTENASSSLLAAISAKDYQTDKPIFSAYTDVNSLVRNVNNPLHTYTGITGLIAWNDRQKGSPFGTLLGGCAITPRHIISAKHAAYIKGYKVYFVTRDNTLIERTVIAHKSGEYPLANTQYGDYIIGVLD